MNDKLINKTEKFKNQVKYIAANKGMTLNELVNRLHEKYGRVNNTSSFSTRLKRGSLTILELLEALELLEHDLKIIDLGE